MSATSARRARHRDVRLLRLLLVSSLLLAAVAARASAAPVPPVGQRLAQVPTPTELSAARGWLAWTVRDETSNAYRLVLRSPAGEVTEPDIDPLCDWQSSFDLGTDAHGRLVALVSHCYARNIQRLGVFTVGGLGESSVELPENREVRAPTIWDGRIAWAQGRAGHQRVYTRRLDWPRSRPSVRVSGRTEDVPTLDLGSRGLAEQVQLADPDAPICGDSLVRFVDLGSGRGRTLRDVGCGEGGQTVIGPSTSGSRVAWLVVCKGDPEGCVGRLGGAFRYDLDGRTAQRRDVGGDYDGFSYAAGQAYGAQVGVDQHCASYLSAADVFTAEPCAIGRFFTSGWAPVRLPRP